MKSNHPRCRSMFCHPSHNVKAGYASPASPGGAYLAVTGGVADFLERSSGGVRCVTGVTRDFSTATWGSRGPEICVNGQGS
ncbi:MAG: hypothetical protein WEB60_05385, partial [Terrimicrobiaceae bacterium]